MNNPGEFNERHHRQPNEFSRITTLASLLHDSIEFTDFH